IGKKIIKACIRPGTLGLVLLLILIAVMEFLMKTGEGVQRIVDSLRRLVPSRRLLFVMMPSFWGMLPSPGGALFSAPYLKELDPANVITPEHKTFLNYWFRHVWEYIIPTYPAVILVAVILNVPYRDVFIAQFPLSISAILGGFIFGFKGSNLPSKENIGGKKKPILILLRELSPILILLFMVLVLKIQLLVGMGVVVFGLFLVTRPSFKKIPDIIRHSVTLNTTILIFGVISFQEMLKETGCLSSVSHYFTAQGMPEYLIFIILPFIVGLLTGASPAMVAISFPILMNLEFTSHIGMFAMAYASGFSGVMLSPLHLCFSLTIQYYKSKISGVYRLMLLPTIIIIITGIILGLTGK
ncbi:MAG: DUF401 family protein, partial [Candidatus Eremiobacteraeota bacterium]|nr:DUF401 family protein [Candidatus Eremiobacteraeota bacterium]